ncbi:MAG TPA: HAMP domain-containing sensor histidine kinase [Chryseolinea sp.]|nr:HAMP domain-containing sensor histidine kinase [Chryseolinea sp.]
MRLLQVSLRSLLLYSIVLLLISIPVSWISIQAMLNGEVDESISRQAEQFLRHIKNFEYLGDLETDLEVFNQLSYDIHINPSEGVSPDKTYQTIIQYDSLEQSERPVRQLSTGVIVKGRSYLLTVQMSLVDNNELVMAIGLVQFALSIVLISGLLFLNRSLSKRLWKPFYKTLDQLKAYNLDKSESVALEKSEITEFDDLNKTVSHLTERNRKVFLNQKEFIENASHELQTPIAIFQSKLDQLMQSSTLSQSEAETIFELETTAQRMSRLNKNLLLLSKIDNEQFLDTEEIDLSLLIQNQLSVLKPVAQVQSMKINTSIDPLLIRANRTLIEVLFSNIFQNAIRHNLKGEDVSVTLRDKTLAVTNKGKALKINVEKMTDRFSKESTDPNSTGLGLAIVKKICDSCGFHLGYRYDNSLHTFEITF